MPYTFPSAKWVGELKVQINSDQEYAPGVDKFTMDSPGPVKADANGKYPIPQPGIVTKSEY